MSANLQPGLIVLHSNQLEQLRDAVFGWVRCYPLAPLEQETFLVQSNGIAEWLKIALASELGVCASTQVELPGRFLWTVYRAMLGRDQIPRTAFLDKTPLTWRLMRLLPELLDDSEFAPLQYFLADGDPARRLQLAARLADLMDSYQVYRTDWLEDWQQGHDHLRKADGSLQALDAAQRWQPKLWRAILNDLPPHERQLGRVNVHKRFVEALSHGQLPASRLPRRVVVFGISALPRQTVEALAALAVHTQVIIAVPNPCQYFWGDIMEGREFFRSAYRRQALRQGRDLSALLPEQLHAHSHPLLAGWGRLGRDFIRMLDEFDQSEQTRNRYPQLKIDLFSEGEGNTLLQQAQAAIRDLLPLHEHPRTLVEADDQSIEFHLCHSRQREVEVLHDRLLQLFADEGLGPHDVIVMVPDIARFSAAIRAVFGQYRRNDPRYIPYEIGDLSDRTANPVIVALEWLLRLPRQRCEQSEILDLLEVPPLAARFGLTPDDLPRLHQWIDGSGIRWGLNEQQRSELGLAATGEQNSWRFGVRRMLFGYAGGEGAGDEQVLAYAEVGGLEAALAGALASLLDMLARWDQRLRGLWTPQEWCSQAHQLLDDFFVFTGSEDKVLLSRLKEGLERWLQACDDAGFTEAVALDVFREPWMAAMEDSNLNYRFLSGGVSFCSFMPMRSMPFAVVCMLGMNEGEFPRSVPAMDFDLLKLPGMQRPGDRSRREDDRYLMLEALLAARRKLYISWAGRNIRDNSEQPPSVLVSQLRDYLQAGWQIDLDAHTTVYPLQPFSLQYFDGSHPALRTFAREWGMAYEALPETALPASAEAATGEELLRLNIAGLVNFVLQPVRYFFQRRLQVNFADSLPDAANEEPFALTHLDLWEYADRVLETLPYEQADMGAALDEAIHHLSLEGRLPIAESGRRWQAQLRDELLPVAQRWSALCAQFPHLAEKHAVRFEHGSIALEDWIDHLRHQGEHTVLLRRTASRLAGDHPSGVRADKLISLWVQQLVMSSGGTDAALILLGRDLQIEVPVMAAGDARRQLQALLDCWLHGRRQMLPVACRTALAWLSGKDPQKIYDGDDFTSGERDNPYLARVWPAFEALAQTEWEQWAKTLYAPLLEWMQQISVISLADSAAEAADAAGSVGSAGREGTA